MPWKLLAQIEIKKPHASPPLRLCVKQPITPRIDEEPSTHFRPHETENSQLTISLPEIL